MSRQTTLGRFGFEKSISHRTSVMETKVTGLILFQLCQGQLSVIMKLYCVYRCFILFKISALALFLHVKYSLNVANFNLDIVIKYILLENSPKKARAMVG